MVPHTPDGRQNKDLDLGISKYAYSTVEGKNMPLSLEFGMNTFRWHLKFSTFDDDDRLRGLVSSAFGDILDFLDDIVAF